MVCTRCGHDNRESARFCGGCGHALNIERACARCGSGIPAGNSFCDACGNRLSPQNLSEHPHTAMPVESQASPVSESASAPPRGGFGERIIPPGALARPTDVHHVPMNLAWRRVLPRLTANREQIESWIIRYQWELLLVALLTTIAAFLRIYRLADLPSGLHGDEALTGLDAIRVMNEGWIGPYVGSALGQPTGPLYFTAFIFRLSVVSEFTLRLSMAILGIATIPLAYLLFRVNFGRWAAIFGLVAITFSFWHLHFSRTAFMVISMPMIISLASLTLLWALRSSRRWPWPVAGIVLGAGVYTYGGYPLFLGAVAVTLVVYLTLHQQRWKELLIRYALLALGFVLIALPFIQFVVTSPDDYLSHARQVSLFRDPRFTDLATNGEKAKLVIERVWGAATLLFQHSEVDGSDATGGRGALDPILAVLAYIGLAIALTRWRSPPYLLAAITVIAGLGIIVSTAVNWGDMRRSLVAVPFVYVLSGVAAQEIVTYSRRYFSAAGRNLAVAGVVASLVAVVVWNSWYYFGRFGEQNHTQWVFASDHVDSLDAAYSFNDPGIIYFYSNRMSYNHETRRFLYPQGIGIDRSKEFGSFSLNRLDPGPVTYVLLPPYDLELDKVRAMYPDGVEIKDTNKQGATRFAVYHLQ